MTTWLIFLSFTLVYSLKYGGGRSHFNPRNTEGSPFNAIQGADKMFIFGVLTQCRKIGLFGHFGKTFFRNKLKRCKCPEVLIVSDVKSRQVIPRNIVPTSALRHSKIIVSDLPLFVLSNSMWSCNRIQMEVATSIVNKVSVW